MNFDHEYRRDRRSESGQREQNGEARRPSRERNYAGDRGNHSGDRGTDREEGWPTTWQPARNWEDDERRDFRESESGSSRREYDRDADWRSSHGYESRAPSADFGRSSRYEGGGWNGSEAYEGQGRSWGTGTSRSGSGMYYGRQQNWRDQDSDWARSSSERQADALLRSRQSFRGRGPKGYQRPDERIQEELNDRLTDDHDVDAGEIECKVKDGEVTLSGTVPDRESKRRAEDLAEELSGVKHVQNNLRVKKSSAGETASGSSSSSTNKERSSTGSMSGTGSLSSTSSMGR